jgi:hypothetical protein
VVISSEAAGYYGPAAAHARGGRKPPDFLKAQLRCYVPYRTAARAFALAASSSRFLGGAFVSSECNKRWATSATPSTAAKNAASFVFDGFAKPLIFLTNWSEAARTSSSVTGGAKLNKGRIFLHIILYPHYGLMTSEQSSSLSTPPSS